MIGTHDSYTFLKARKKWLEVFSFLWRTQVLTIEEQKKLGVKYFDVRVRRDGDRWRVCHGFVDFNLTFKTLKGIMAKFPSSYVRIILERGSKEDGDIFAKELSAIKSKVLDFACIKKGWEVLLPGALQIKDYSYIPWHSGWSFWGNLTNMNFFSTVKRFARAHNPIITEKMVQDKRTVHFMDYINDSRFAD